MKKIESELINLFSERVSKSQINLISNKLISSTEYFETAQELIFSADKRIAWQIAWVLEVVSKKEPLLFSDNIIFKIRYLTLNNQHEGLQRLLISILNNLPINNHQIIDVNFINSCFEQLYSPQKSIAVRVLSMKQLLKICEIKTEFCSELKIYTEEIQETTTSPALLATSKHTLKRLDKIQSCFSK